MTTEESSTAPGFGCCAAEGIAAATAASAKPAQTLQRKMGLAEKRWVRAVRAMEAGASHNDLLNMGDPPRPDGGSCCYAKCRTIGRSPLSLKFASEEVTFDTKPRDFRRR